MQATGQIPAIRRRADLSGCIVMVFERDPG
jgi:hypothetical protein